MMFFQVFPYRAEDHTRAVAIDAFGKSSVLRAPSSRQLGTIRLAFPRRAAPPSAAQAVAASRG